jgi:twitching motility protein PilT
MDAAAELGCDLVNVWNGQDGYDYTFQADYLEERDWLVEGLRECAEYRSDIRLSLEYKPKEPRTHSYLGTAAGTLVLVQELGLPNAVRMLVAQTKGLILITGSTSQGKSSTLSGMIDHINTNQRKHIITIEDPIEHVHANKKSVVRQRQVGRDTRTYASGLRAALRQDPDVIAIGEMRDYDSIRIALTAAETGVLVISTLHVISIDKMIERLLSYAPEEDVHHIRYLLADALQGVVHQELIPATDGGKCVGCEVLIAVDAVRNIIRRGESFMLRNIIHTGSRYGMISMRQSIGQLLERGRISQEMAERVLANY